MNSRNDPDCDYVYKGNQSPIISFAISRFEWRNGCWQIEYSLKVCYLKALTDLI